MNPMTDRVQRQNPSAPAAARPQVAAAQAPAEVEAEPKLRNIFMKWAPPAMLGAVGLSMLIHAMLGLVAALVLVGGAQAGGSKGEGNGETVGVAIMTEAELGSIMQAAGMESETPAVAEAPTQKLPGSEVEIQIADGGAGGQEAGSLGEGSGKLTSGLGAGNITGGQGLGGGGGGAANFFGVEARGTRFAYICDISGSMDQGVGSGELRRVDILKSELGKSLNSLLENAFFFVSLFSTESKAMGGRMEWVASTDAGKQWAKRTVPLIVAEGATEPMAAFKMVFRLRPKPDAIYFMTDGEFNEEYVNEIARLNAEYHIPINCITFVSREGEKMMRKIAQQSGGTYAHFSGPGG